MQQVVRYCRLFSVLICFPVKFEVPMCSDALAIPIFCPILSAIGTPSNKLAKFCDKLVKPITTNEYTIKHWFSFAKEVEEFDSNLITVDSLYLELARDQ